MLLLPSSLLCVPLVFVVQPPRPELCCVGPWGVRLWCALPPPSCRLMEPPFPGVQWDLACWLVGCPFFGLLGWLLVSWFVGC